MMMHILQRNRKERIKNEFLENVFTRLRFKISITIGTAPMTRLLSTAAVVHAKIYFFMQENLL